jgi:hypothetical protein
VAKQLIPHSGESVGNLERYAQFPPEGGVLCAGQLQAKIVTRGKTYDAWVGIKEPA